MALKAHQYELRKVFCSDFDFLIPHYQRPYAWGTEQALQLLDDLKDALDRGADDPYFLGSLVLVKESDDAPSADVIDGQQRLTTLSLLFAVLRDLAESATTRTVLSDMVLEPGIALDGIAPKPRLRLRDQDAGFFDEYVQSSGSIDKLTALSSQALKTDSQKAIRDNAKAMRDRLADWSEESRDALAALARNRTFLVIVTTPDLASAHRIFSVMNARGLDLTPSDIFKSQVIGSMVGTDQAAYATKWETAEQNLGRIDFAELFLHLRTIFAKIRGRRELLLEFPEQVLNSYLENDATAKSFVDDVMLPYATAYGHLTNQNFDEHDAEWNRVNDWLRRLVQLDNNDWRPPALWALRRHPDDPAFLDAFLRKLERLAASMLLRRVYATPRALRYIELLKQLDGGAGLDAGAFDLTNEEVALTLEKIEDKLYLTTRVSKYVLLRLDELLANDPGVQYNHRIISVEHVLPQTPKDGSQWKTGFTEEQREYWTHRIGNLLLLNRAKNSEAQNYDFGKKKQKYFTSTNGVAAFALTTQVLGHSDWTPEVISDRQRELVDRLRAEWKLS